MKKLLHIFILTVTLVSMMTTNVFADTDKKTGTITASALNVRTEPSTESQSLGLLPYGASVELKEQVGSWYEISFMDQVGYIFGEYVKVTDKSETKEDKAAELIEIAKQYIGTPYVYGGTTPNGFDCSGFVQYVYQKVGITLPRTSYSQATVGTSVTYEELMPGDIVCFGANSINHVGIYVGDGQFIHSPRTGYTVCVTAIRGGSYNGKFRYARRVL